MRIHWLQHVSFEGLGCIGPWLVESGHEVTCSRLWAGEIFPDLGPERSERGSAHAGQRPEGEATVDGLIVMGGPMGVYDEAIYPWLAAEKAFIKEVISQNKPVLGICLGAQLIAEVLGARVWKNEHKEIGFFPMAGTGPMLPAEFTAFHWHGDTFGIPNGAVHLASSKATGNQAFLYKDNVLALQFHLETTEESLLLLYENAKDEIAEAPFIQSLEKMKENFPTLGTANALMKTLLSRLFPAVTGYPERPCSQNPADQ